MHIVLILGYCLATPPTGFLCDQDIAYNKWRYSDQIAEYQ